MKDRDVAEWARDLHLFLDDMTREEGVIATGEATTEVVLTQQEKLDLMTVTQSVNLDTMEQQAQDATDALDSLSSFVITNDSTDLTLDADDAAGAISAGYVQAEIENIRDAVLGLADNVATLIRALRA